MSSRARRRHGEPAGLLVAGVSIPAVLIREILLRRTPLRSGGWLFVLVTAVALAVSALYELIEWWTALATGEAAQAFLGPRETLGTPNGTCSWRWSAQLALLAASKSPD